MKSKQLLSVLLGSTLIFAACGNGNDAEKTEDKAKTETEAKDKKNEDTKSTENKESTSKEKASEENTSEVKESVEVIDKAKEAGKDIKSYHAVLDASMESDGQSNNISMVFDQDNKGTTKVENDADQQLSNLYIFNNKVVANQNDQQYLDVTKQMGKEVNKQIDQINYNSFVNSLDTFKNAVYNKTKDGYSLTMSYSNIDEYKNLLKENGSENLIKSIEKQLKDIKGKETIYFDKNYLVKSSKRESTTKINDKEIKSVTEIKYDKFNKVSDITIPEEVKNAKTFEAYQKEMQKKAQNGSSTEEK
ncbi:DUF6612 family protein [Macrococcoides caseolyticum]|uniref:DUF6612 family protein n=1 Tax=Macrococcoides caseolyticum TaxID=69966 RepID=UPI001F1BD920|nr:DUF6612 family protein [Macrococcus caseolyticus]MCE4956418.1 hypothetical protein [Macrococcus caseolyticus]